MKDPERVYDVRVVDRYIAAGVLTREEYEKYLASLPDVSADAVETNAQFVHTGSSSKGRRD